MSAMSAATALRVAAAPRVCRALRARRAASRPARALVVAAAGKPPLVKVCGVTSVADCALAVEQGADFIGMILWPKSKRSIDFALAREIASIAKEGGATPVGVFVDESVDAIVSACKDVGIDHAQLHGDGARLSLKDLPMSIKAIWVVNADKDGVIVTPLPGDEDALMKQRTDAMGANPVTAAVDFVKGPRRVVDWILVDGETAGSGETYDWTNLKPPRGASRKGWLLAGGLDPENVAEAVAVCKPTGVDVASGVTDDSGVKKDASKVEAFIKNAKK
jgi:phosphoribosylanthranilate isomerase